MEFEEFCAQKRLAGYRVEYVLEWLQTLPPEVRAGGIRIARLKLEVQSWKEATIRHITRRNQLERAVKENRGRLAELDLTTEERAEIEDAVQGLDAQASAQWVTVESMKESVGKAWAQCDEFASMYGDPLASPHLRFPTPSRDSIA